MSRPENNFWLKLAKIGKIYALAPMAGITDSPFRQICHDFGADVLYSEMASVAALTYAPAKTLELIKATKKESPYVVQLFGSDPKQFAHAAKSIQYTGYSIQGFDINFGCPVAKVMKQGAGCALFTDLKKSREVIKAVLANTDLPVSIKTRVACGEIDVLKFLDNVADLPIAAIMIHGRTFKQGFSGPIDCAIIKKAREHFNGVILANGGIMDRKQAEEVLALTNADGLGIGRGALGRPWVFAKGERGKVKGERLGREEIFKIMLKHGKLVEKAGGNFAEFRKHLCWYVAGLPEAKVLRQKLVKVENLDQVKAILKPLL